MLSTRARPLLLLPSVSRELNATNDDDESDCNADSIEEKLADDVVDVDLARGAQNGRGHAAGTAKVQIDGMGIISGGARGGGDGRTRALELVETGASGVRAVVADCRSDSVERQLGKFDDTLTLSCRRPRLPRPLEEPAADAE